MAKTPANNRSYHHGDLKETLLQASLELVSEKGPHGFTLAEVCRKAGVSVAAPYRHYRDKEALLAAIAVSGFELFYDCLASALAASEDKTYGALEALAHASVNFAISNPSRYKVMFGSDLSKVKFPELYATARRAFDVVFCTVEACLIAGGKSTDNTYSLSVSIWSHCHGISMLCVDGFLREIAMEQKVVELIDLAVKSFVGQLQEA
ncbi:MAG: TetR/AcrR family transcriptional regulator [Cyanobacteria bacterium SZAS LIN-3]|nr:TetR/AcrR family transcriptional regulator [Cyanobacteria bacterium SZAS LIN-3]